SLCCLCFFFQAEDGIRDRNVTGVQTCALPILNGDAAPWIRAGVDYFESAVYTYDRYHLKKWIKEALRNRSKQERRKAYLVADANDPTALLVAVAEAERAENRDEK